MLQEFLQQYSIGRPTGLFPLAHTTHLRLMSRYECRHNSTPSICFHGIHSDFTLNKAHPDKYYYSQYGITFLTDFPFQFLFVLIRYNGYAA